MSYTMFIFQPRRALDWQALTSILEACVSSRHHWAISHEPPNRLTVSAWQRDLIQLIRSELLLANLEFEEIYEPECEPIIIVDDSDVTDWPVS